MRRGHYETINLIAFYALSVYSCARLSNIDRLEKQENAIFATMLLLKEVSLILFIQLRWKAYDAKATMKNQRESSYKILPESDVDIESQEKTKYCSRLELSTDPRPSAAILIITPVVQFGLGVAALVLQQHLKTNDFKKWALVFQASATILEMLVGGVMLCKKCAPLL